jgi:hypothetical protein
MGDQPDARPIAQQRKININMYVVSGIRTHDVCVQAIKAYASESEAIVTGQKFKANPCVPRPLIVTG